MGKLSILLFVTFILVVSVTEAKKKCAGECVAKCGQSKQLEGDCRGSKVCCKRNARGGKGALKRRAGRKQTERIGRAKKQQRSRSRKNSNADGQIKQRRGRTDKRKPKRSRGRQSRQSCKTKKKCDRNAGTCVPQGTCDTGVVDSFGCNKKKCECCMEDCAPIKKCAKKNGTCSTNKCTDFQSEAKGCTGSSCTCCIDCEKSGAKCHDNGGTCYSKAAGCPSGMVKNGKKKCGYKCVCCIPETTTTSTTTSTTTTTTTPTTTTTTTSTNSTSSG